MFFIYNILHYLDVSDITDYSRLSSAVRVSASQSLGSRFKTRQDPDSLTYSKIAASAVLMSGVFRGFGISGLGIGEKGFSFETTPFVTAALQ